jgi:lipopolysaccharide/colanic/teichoic acid biosynthesis glycosyltransferase
MKRVFDICFSLLALSLFAVPGVCIAVLLRFWEHHPVFFRQERVGLGKKPFTILKFQTMVDGVPTRLGQILRSTGIDEWAQFINVLRGDMSIIGPRALTFADVERLGWNDRFHAIRWNIKPGISGLAQIYGGQHRKVSWFWDIRYIKRHNLALDFTVIFISFIMNISGKRRVRRIIFKNKHLK